MATDFAAYANLRFLWPRPATITTLRDGIPASSDLVVIEAFAKGAAATPQEMQSLRYGTRVLEGYVCRYATLPAGGDWLSAGSSWSWTDTGLMPTGLAAQALCRAYLGDLASLPTRTDGGILGEVTILGVAGQFGVGGIGAELRAALGDAIRVSFATVQ